MSSIATTRCFNHTRREAVARCPVCGHFFCRECIIEHDGRMICARCLLPTDSPSRKGKFLLGVFRFFQVLAAVMLLWSSFFLIGRALLHLPSDFHEGNLPGLGGNR